MGSVRRPLCTYSQAASALTPERLINPGRKGRKPAPEGFLQRLLYDVTFHLVNIGDSYRVRERKALEARINRALHGGARFVLGRALGQVE